MCGNSLREGVDIILVFISKDRLPWCCMNPSRMLRGSCKVIVEVGGEDVVNAHFRVDEFIIMFEYIKGGWSFSSA